MTEIAFDAGSGRLQASQSVFDTLVACARGHRDPGPELPALRDAGAVRPDGPHPALAPALRAVTQPVCRLRLTATDQAGGLKAGDGWVDSGSAALLLDMPGERRDFFAVPPDYLPATIARVVRLGPRPRARPEPVPLRAEQVDRLDVADPAERTRAAEGLGGVLERQRLAGPWRSWRAQITWTGQGGGLTRREVQVVDAEPGLYLAESDGEYATLWPTTPSAVWRLLIRLLPDTAELG